MKLPRWLPSWLKLLWWRVFPPKRCLFKAEFKYAIKPLKEEHVRVILFKREK